VGSELLKFGPAGYNRRLTILSLASRLAYQFDQRVQFRGVTLFRDHAVRVNRESSNQLLAVVMGGNAYQVAITYDNGRLLVSCECPYFSDFGQCKHLWAAMLEADRIGALAEAMQAKYLKLEDDPRFDDEEEDAVVPPFRLLPPVPSRIPAWQEHLSFIRHEIEQKKSVGASFARNSQILYIVDLAASRTSGAMVVELFFRTRKKNGDWSVAKPFKIVPAQADSLPDPVDAEAIAAMLGGQEYYAYGYYSASASATRKSLPAALALKVIPLIAAAGRLRLRTDSAATDLQSAQWDDGEPWKLWLKVTPRDGEQWSIEGSLRRAEQTMDLSQPLLLLESGLLATPGLVARFDAAGAFPWVAQLRSLKRISFRDSERDKVLEELLALPAVPPMELDDALKFEERRVTPRLGLRIVEQRDTPGEESFQAHLLFDYGRGWLEDRANGSGIWLAEERVFLPRDLQVERAARETLKGLGLKPPTFRQRIFRYADSGAAPLRLAAKTMPRAVRELLRAGWHVEAEGKAFRPPGATRVEVSSGIDWFELQAEVDYGDAKVSLPMLLEALRRGDNMVPLGDGSFGLLPEDWLEQFAPLAGLGREEDGHLRFKKNQAGLLDAMLIAQPEVHVDEMFERARQGLRSFEGMKPAPQPEGFVGQLRDYQRLRRLPGGRHGRRQNGAGSRDARIAARQRKRTVAGHRSPVFDVQLARRSGPLHTALARIGTHRHGARSKSHLPSRSRLEHLWNAVARCAPTRCDPVRLRGSRRSAGHQERIDGLRQSGAIAARRASIGAQRHSGRKSSGRAMEPVRILKSGHAGRSQGPEAGRRLGAQSKRRVARAAPASAAPLHLKTHQTASCQRASRQDRTDHFLRIGRNAAQTI
jgi:hypothetical protein